MAVLALGLMRVAECKKKVISKRELSREEVAKLGIYLPEKVDRDSIEKRDGAVLKDIFDAFSVDVDNDNREEIVVYLHLLFFISADAHYNASYHEEYFRIYKEKGGSYKLFQELDLRYDSAYLGWELEIMDLDNNGFADLVLRFSTGGSGGGGQISIYEWNGNKFTIASSETEKWIEIEDVNENGQLELINWTYLDSSLKGYPSTGGMVLWPDIQTYFFGHIVTANEQFPDYYKKLYEENAMLLDSIKSGTADEFTLDYKDYYIKTSKEIMKRCKSLME